MREGLQGAERGEEEGEVRRAESGEERRGAKGAFRAYSASNGPPSDPSWPWLCGRPVAGARGEWWRMVADGSRGGGEMRQTVQFRVTEGILNPPKTCHHPRVAQDLGCLGSI